MIALVRFVLSRKKVVGGEGEEEEVPGQRIEQVDWLLSQSRMPAQP